VDELDARLLGLLRDDGRLTMAELGRRVGLSRTATLARVRRLEATGAIRGYHADVRAGAAGVTHVARVGIVIRGADTAAYVRRLRAVPEITEIEAVAGEIDLLVRVMANGAEALDEVLDRVGSWPQTQRTTTFLVLRSYPTT
jgi:Lrp/AsnC family transcriptional regulator, leucine-responsive regulatory protein